MPSPDRRPAGWRPRTRFALLAVLVILLLGLAGVARLWVAISTIAPLSRPADLLATITGASDAKPGSPSWKLQHGEPVNILLLGNNDPAHRDYQTDSMLLLSLRAAGQQAVLLSIPRDILARIPAIPAGGFITARIDNAYAIGLDRTTFPDVRDEWKTPTGGGDLAAATVTEVIGLPVDGWIAVDFRAFRHLVDAVGGVEVDVPTTLDDPQYPSTGTTGFTHVHFAPGPQRMNGERALEYARSRLTTSDVDRTARQRRLVVAIRHKLDSVLSVPQLVGVLLAVQDDVRTDLRPEDALQLGRVLSRLPDSHIRQTTIDSSLFDQVPTPDGYFVLEPKDPTYAALHVSVGEVVATPAG